MKLKINNMEYVCTLAHFSIGDCIDDEVILYNETTNKIIVMNITATHIYRLLQESCEKSNDISDVEISNYLFSIFNIDEFQKVDVIGDVRDILKNFICEGVLIVSNDLLDESDLRY